MATRTRTRAEVLDDDEGLTAQTAMPIHHAQPVAISHDTDDEELTPADRIRALIGQAQGDEGTKIKLYRIDPKTPGGMPWCADYTPEEFEAGDLEMIRRQWGAGRYHVRVINRRGIAARVDVTIAEPLQAPTAAPAVAQNSELAQVMRVLAEGQARILDALSNRPDPMQEMQRMAAMMATMREAMGLNNAPQVAPATASPQALLGDLVSAIKTLREISSEVNPPAPADPDNPLALVGPIVELVKVARQNPQPVAAAPIQPISMPRQNAPMRRANPAPRPMAQPAPNGVSLPVTQAAPRPAAQPIPQPAPQPAAQPDESPDMNPALLMVLNEVRALIRDMVQRASVNGDTDEAAEILFEKLPDDAFDYLERENWFELFTQLAPEVRPHRAWFERVKTRLDEIIEEEMTGDGADEGETLGEAAPAPDEQVIIPGSAI